MKKKKAQKTQTEYEIVKFLSQGSYNCAHVICRNNEQQVLRVALLPKQEDDTTSNAMVKRGIQIVAVFQQYQDLLGPSLIIEKAEHEFRAVKLAQLKLNRDLLCSTIVELAEELDEKEVPYEFAIQVIELLKGGAFTHDAFQKMNQDEHLFALFSLLWFFYNTHVRFDLRHHDVKADNIIMREFDEPKIFTFAISDRLFVFESRFVPVVIDYDFATVFSTRDGEARNANGTPYTASPDATLRQIFKLLSSSVSEEEEDNDIAGAYDWWSLGIAFLEFLLPDAFGTFNKRSPVRGKPDVPVLFAKERAAYAWDVLERLPKVRGIPNAEVATQSMFTLLGCAVACLAAEGNTLVPPADCRAYRERDVFFDPTFMDAVLKTEEYASLRAAHARLPQGVRDVLRMLLSWYPERRSYMTRSYMFLYEPCFSRFEDPEHGLGDFHFECDIRGWMEDSVPYQKAISLTAYPLLEACVSCGTRKNISACVCCDLIFCSEQCQDKRHY